MDDNAESKVVADLIRVNAVAAPSLPNRARRAQHAKHHGCVRAAFTVRDDVPEDLRSGLFAKPGRYEALIRFSNGRQQDDRRADAHGMAVKLLGVAGDTLLEGSGNEGVQDFVLVDSEVFFTGDVEEYHTLNVGLLQPGQSLLERLKIRLALLVLHAGLLVRISRFASKTPTSPLSQTYYSATPYAVGDRCVKWLARPVSRRPAVPLHSADGLADALVRELAGESFLFDFGVDVRTDAAAQPVEDPTVAWSKRPGARREWLAQIEIAPQAVDPAATLAEDLSFSPWHGLRQHEPLGHINRLRKPIYRGLAIRRHELNGVVPADTAGIPADPRTTAG